MQKKVLTGEGVVGISLQLSLSEIIVLSNLATRIGENYLAEDVRVSTNQEEIAKRHEKMVNDLDLVHRFLSGVCESTLNLGKAEESLFGGKKQPVP